MAIIKCKMCGGDLNLIEGQSVAECEYCGSRQTVPSADSEKKLALFARANKLRAACEFDKAAGIYESIVADFPEEAEAYWGLVLCKYGIEYVDDPATGKKIPTCHRSSFDSVREDSNLGLTIEYADAKSRKLYQEEAKQIEELRKDIIEVSAKEDPYDIFICYKETDADGNRTLDSVLAQDTYDALTGRGYRVFFSRITLEEKLGQEYEPYIFAALNSAKVMLAIGTSFDHYNAVWVKNEWSRFLKLMEKDKSKHLIPCFKGIDAYDMPKEFARLQAQDLGKVGAISDLLRGIEKLVPLQNSNTVVIQEKVVVGGSGNNKIAALLERGNMALEDGDWAKADSFFEDVLNNDAKNAQAYIGKTLALERCRTMDALVRKRKDVYQNVSSETLFIDEKTAHIEKMAEQYSLHGYVATDSIRELYEFDLSYLSEVSGRQKQYREEENWWQNHKQLSRAEKFAVGAVAEHLQSEKKHLFAQLAERVKKAQEANAKAIAKAEAAYDAHITEADKQAEQLYNDGLARREQHYQGWLNNAKNATTPDVLKKIAAKFDGLGDYKDSKNLAEHCRKRAADEQAKIDAENARKAEAARQAAAARAKRNKTIAMIAAIAAVLVIAVTMIVTKVIIPGNNYKAAVALMKNGQYEEAIAVLEALGGYRDSADRIVECNESIETRRLAELEEEYNTALALLDAGRYEDAIAAFKALGKYKDSVTQIDVCQTAILESLYQQAVNIFDQGQHTEAQILFRELSGYKDSSDFEQYCYAKKLLNEGDVPRAAVTFGKLRGFKDSKELANSLWNQIAIRETICTGPLHTVGLRANGTVIAIGDNSSGQCNVGAWKNVIAVSAGYSHTVALRTDGTVITVGNDYDGFHDTAKWVDIVAISANYKNTVGLKSDGTVTITGIGNSGQAEVENWTDIIAVSTGEYHTVGIRVDGTVVAAGSNKEGQCNVSNWKSIVAVCACDDYTVGLKSDGTVVAVGSYPEYINSWNNVIAISGNDRCTVLGLKSDGTTVVAEPAHVNNQWNAEEWREIVAISAGGSCAIGLRVDGTVIAAGSNLFGQCNTSDWRNIKLPR